MDFLLIRLNTPGVLYLYISTYEILFTICEPSRLLSVFHYIFIGIAMETIFLSGMHV